MSIQRSRLPRTPLCLAELMDKATGLAPFSGPRLKGRERRGLPPPSVILGLGPRIQAPKPYGSKQINTRRDAEWILGPRPRMTENEAGELRGRAEGDAPREDELSGRTRS
jgi:hypothetical protein